MVYRLYSKDRTFFFYIKKSSYLCAEKLRKECNLLELSVG